MRYAEPLVEGRLIRRYKRFLADVDLAGEVVTAHCGNPGSMMGLAAAGSPVWLSRNGNPKAKLDWRWEIATQAVDGAAQTVGINTGLANRLAEEAVAAGRIAPLAGYETLRREVKYGQSSRIDLLLEDPERPPCYVEVKSVTLRRPEGRAAGAAEFPDAVTARGAKHLAELSDMADAGARGDAISCSARRLHPSPHRRRHRPGLRRGAEARARGGRRDPVLRLCCDA